MSATQIVKDLPVRLDVQNQWIETQHYLTQILGVIRIADEAVRGFVQCCDVPPDKFVEAIGAACSSE